MQNLQKHYIIYLGYLAGFLKISLSMASYGQMRTYSFLNLRNHFIGIKTLHNKVNIAID